ncbi:hypothetical protein L2E82_39403 [Cichorium intybus]|uniref:Uncharacterized protein n=1 Tax=Cichorium intybus TaxID=13427 RepID=A0ACB9AHL8_CICIN|nr:hypothetical protein L2E82_39403 [Cichorium intybus]
MGKVLSKPSNQASKDFSENPQIITQFVLTHTLNNSLIFEKTRKLSKPSNQASKYLSTHICGAHIVAPCPHDGACPLDNTRKYCHLVQRLQRTTSQLAYKQSNGVPLGGFEDEKFSYVVFRRGPRPT